MDSDNSTRDAIYWNYFCGNASQYNAFWDSKLSIDTTRPDLTDCFQKSIFTWTTCGLLWLFSLLYIPYLWKLKEAYPWGHCTKLNLLKVVAGSFLSAISLLDLIWYASRGADSSYHAEPVDIADAAIRFASFVSVFSGFMIDFPRFSPPVGSAIPLQSYLRVCEHGFVRCSVSLDIRKGIHSSPLLFIFWLLQFVFGIITLRSLIIRDTPKPSLMAVTFYVRFGLIVISFLCSLFADISPYYRYTSIATKEANGGPTTPCPKLSASCLSVAFFWWFTPTIITGWKRTLTNDDIWAIRDEDSTHDIVPVFLKNWENEKIKAGLGRSSRKQPDSRETSKGDAAFRKYGTSGSPTDKDVEKVTVAFIDGSESTDKAKSDKSPSLVTALVRTFIGYFSMGGVLLLMYVAVSFVNPFLLRLLLDFIKEKSPYAWHGYLYALGMFLSSLCGVLCQHHQLNFAYTTGLRVRTALTAAVYRKALTLSQATRTSSSVGEIVNLMSVDTQKCQDVLAFLNYIWSAPITLVIAVYFLYQILGPSCFAGVGFLLVFLPINSMILTKKMREYQRSQMGLKDDRLKLMNQMLSGIKLLKFYAWEADFMNKIFGIRDEELKVLKKGSIFGAITYIMWFCSSFLVALLCFATFVLSSPDNILDAQTAFVSMSLINLLNFPITILPPSIMFLVQAMVSVRRLEKFLMQKDIDPDSVHHDPHIPAAISIRSGTFSWGEEEPAVVKDVNMSVAPGRLVAVVGQVGCGKSTLLSAILGEIHKVEGSVNVNGSIAYAPQQAWIQNLTLRDNILFSKPFDEAKYNKVLDACALRQDIAILSAGDSTEIGERGINLSGGQKQRVSLARAVYQDADIYLLDDTLSAVDAHVGKHIFKEVIGPEGLLKNKTRVLVTHGISFLPKADEIIVLKNNKVSEQGSYQELLSHNGPFAEFIHAFLKETSSDNEDLDEEVKEQVVLLQKQLSVLSDMSDNDKSPTHSRKSSIVSLKSGGAGGSASRVRLRRPKSKSGTNVEDSPEKDASKIPAKGPANKLIEEEVAEEGAVKLSVLKGYVSSAAAVFPIVLTISLCAFITGQVLTNIWLSMWTQQPIYNGTVDRAETNLYLGVYGALGGAQTLAVLGLALSISLGSIDASRNLHSSLLSNVLRCPMSFFDTTPLGRVVNRFSKDVDIVDTNIPQFTQNMLITFASLVSTIIVIMYSTPIFVAVIVPLLIIFVCIQRVYVACGRQIKRIDSVRRSPMYAFFSETLNGTSSIRAYKQQDRFVSKSDFLLDSSQRVWFEAFSSNRWIGVWAEFLGNIIILSTAIFAVVGRDTLNPGLVGLSVSYALQVNMSIIMTVRSSCELETYIVAVERIKEYTELESEAATTNPDYQPPREWPSNGEIEFKNYSTRYRAGLDLVLKDLSCRMGSGEKVGIIGRTGAGKSSMTLALFRIIEPCGGSIFIDGFDICRMGLQDVRKKLTVIAQDPVLFSGTLRFNIDPSESYTDEEVWRALEHSHLKAFVETLPDTIYHECGEDGKNLSVGQRQLVCLARALLRKSKVLVLDEATAAVDLETDDLIQATIRSEFADCTVLTIAHRLNTIMDYDRVMVLQKGEILEYGAPSALLADTQSAFYSMAKDAGLV